MSLNLGALGRDGYIGIIQSFSKIFLKGVKDGNLDNFFYTCDSHFVRASIKASYSPILNALWTLSLTV